jgi:hypothetical protein
MIRRKKDYSKRTGNDQEIHLREWKTASQANAFPYASVAP